LIGGWIPAAVYPHENGGGNDKEESKGMTREK